ncbi:MULTISPECIES: hypothetical protein [Bacillus cereus group]|uniref:hypothetical protein n=1 Tax=Bacillus cereus group TaxID=86661 RepID=UPI000D9C0217|nr:hypothetical protein [Bacillus cereus]MCU4948962.1 hypothetical protein [Bacillus cereus]SPT76113.1 Phage protein [Bacillus cereus]
MRFQYRYLGLTIGLIPLKELRHLYNYSRSRAEVEVILNYMKTNGVFDNQEYKGYFSFSQVLEEDLYGKEEDILNEGVLIECKCIVLEEFI